MVPSRPFGREKTMVFQNFLFLLRGLLGTLSGPTFGSMGGLLGASWASLASFWAHLGSAWCHAVGHWSHVGASLRPSWHRLSHLEASCCIWRLPGQHVGTIGMPFGVYFEQMFASCLLNFRIILTYSEPISESF